MFLLITARYKPKLKEAGKYMLTCNISQSLTKGIDLIFFKDTIDDVVPALNLACSILGIAHHSDAIFRTLATKPGFNPIYISSLGTPFILQSWCPYVRTSIHSGYN